MVRNALMFMVKGTGELEEQALKLVGVRPSV